MKRKHFLVVVFSFYVLFISLFLNSNLSIAQSNDFSLNIQNNFEFNEFSSLDGKLLNINQINISLPSTNWKITNINLNFTDLNFNIETITIEDQPFDYERVYFQNDNFDNYGLATQIKLNHRARINGVFIYGRRTSTQDIQVQIQGYNAISNIPNGTIISTTTINMSSTNGWYFQNFSSPITLTKGNYFLVLNGTNLNVNGNTFYWYYNSPATDPSLYSSLDYENSWLDGVNNTTFLYKLKYQNLPPIYPESINMSAKINNKYFNVQNTTSSEQGNLEETFQNFNPGTDFLYIPIFNNISETLTFDLNYELNLEKILTTQGTVSVKQSKTNEWILSPILIRQTDNYTVKFNYPRNWENISIFRNEENMESNVTISLTENFIFIPNNTLTEASDWEIKAESPNFSFELNAPKTDYYLGQELRFSLTSPIRPGNYTFILIDAVDIEEFRITKAIPDEINVFSYEIPSNSPDGTYIAYVFWNNGTDAGVQSQQFIISLAPASQPPDLSLIIAIIVILSVGSVSAVSIYVIAKKIVKKRRYNMERLLNKCIDILNLNYLIVTDNKSGLDLYSESYGDKKLDSSLISGFLQAVREFGTHISERDSRIVKLDYKDTIILMKEFVNIRLILNMKDTPSEDFIYSMESLAYDIYKKYGDLVDDYRGNIKKFKEIKSLVEKHLNVSFLSPFKIFENPNIKLSPSEKAMVNKAKKFVKDHNFDYFYSLYLLPENECSPKDAETILDLINMGIFKPIK